MAETSTSLPRKYIKDVRIWYPALGKWIGDGVVPISENNESKDDDDQEEGRSGKGGNRTVRSWNINNPPGSLNLLSSGSKQGVALEISPSYSHQRLGLCMIADGTDGVKVHRQLYSSAPHPCTCITTWFMVNVRRPIPIRPVTRPAFRNQNRRTASTLRVSWFCGARSRLSLQS